MSDPLVSEKLENGLAWLLLCLSVSQFSVDDSILKCGNSRDAGKQTVITEPLFVLIIPNIFSYYVRGQQVVGKLCA